MPSCCCLVALCGPLLQYQLDKSYRTWRQASLLGSLPLSIIEIREAQLKILHLDQVGTHAQATALTGGLILHLDKTLGHVFRCTQVENLWTSSMKMVLIASHCDEPKPGFIRMQIQNRCCWRFSEPTATSIETGTTCPKGARRPKQVDNKGKLSGCHVRHLEPRDMIPVDESLSLCLDNVCLDGGQPPDR